MTPGLDSARFYAPNTRTASVFLKLQQLPSLPPPCPLRRWI